MKAKLSISIDEELVKELQEQITLGRFRNKSHMVEYAVNSFVKQDNG
jgi:Arc/MetJ-type ribon-helix-helix transcriptional regulator